MSADNVNSQPKFSKLHFLHVTHLLVYGYSCQPSKL